MNARRVVAGALLGVVVLSVGACTPSPSPVLPAAPAVAASPAPSRPLPSSLLPTSPVPESPGPPGSGQAVADQASVDRLFAAGVSGDRAGWDAGVLALDPTFALRSSLLYDNLRTLRPSRLRVRLTGAEQSLSPARLAGHGAGARVLQARLGWRLPGERADATSTVWLTLVPGPSGARLAGTDDGAALDTPAVPLWWLTRVARVTRGDVTVVVGPGQSARRWAALASRAASDAATHLPPPLRRRWDGHLVVEVPGTGADLAHVLGAAPSAYATTAAVTRPEGPTTGAAVRVVVNPAVAGDSDAELGTTLVHETVHVATRSAGSAAPLWAVEGLAEHVALEAHPDQRPDEVAELRGEAVPGRLPTDAAFTAGGQDVTAAYAQAWLACRAVAEHRGGTDLGRFYLALDRGASVQVAARSTLHVDDAVVVRWWRAALRQATARPQG